MISAAATLSAGMWTVVSGAWNLDAEVVRKMQEEVHTGFELQAPLVGPKSPLWPDYAFQVHAEIWRNRKIILVNGVCQRFLDRFDMNKWQTVSDGGPCFFRAKYDAEDGKVVAFMFNGPVVPSKASSQAEIASSAPSPSSAPPVQRN